MSKLEQVSKGMMEELEDTKLGSTPFDLEEIVYNNQAYRKTPEINEWYVNHYFASLAETTELQLKLIKHMWLNDPQFEEEKPKKYVVRSKKADDQGDFIYLYLNTLYGLTYPANAYIDENDAEKFNTREEAEKWENPLMEVVLLPVEGDD